MFRGWVSTLPSPTYFRKADCDFAQKFFFGRFLGFSPLPFVFGKILKPWGPQIVSIQVKSSLWCFPEVYLWQKFWYFFLLERYFKETWPTFKAHQFPWNSSPASHFQELFPDNYHRKWKNIYPCSDTFVFYNTKNLHNCSKSKTRSSLVRKARSGFGNLKWRLVRR